MLEHLYKQQLTVKTGSSTNEYNVKTFTSTITINAFVEYETRVILDKTGASVIYSAIVHTKTYLDLLDVVVLDSEDRDIISRGVSFNFSGGIDHYEYYVR